MNGGYKKEKMQTGKKKEGSSKSLCIGKNEIKQCQQLQTFGVNKYPRLIQLYCLPFL